MTLRRKLYAQLEPRARDGHGISLTNRIIGCLIIVSAAFAILETETTIISGREKQFLLVEDILTAVFVVEYLIRIWIAGEDGRYGTGYRACLRYIVSPAALIDLLAIAPILLTFAGSEVFLLRLFRFMRLLRIARLGRFSTAIRHVRDAIACRKHELLVSLMIASLLLVLSSTLLYLIEGDIQSEAFGSIPRAMWWSVATLTTVGYGDVYPLTPVGRIVAGLTALTGIGLVAVPTGILASAFSDVMHKHRAQAETHPEETR